MPSTTEIGGDKSSDSGKVHKKGNIEGSKGIINENATL